MEPAESSRKYTRSSPTCSGRSAAQTLAPPAGGRDGLPGQSPTHPAHPLQSTALAKGKVKRAVCFITAFETALAHEAARRNLHGVVCGPHPSRGDAGGRGPALLQHGRLGGELHRPGRADGRLPRTPLHGPHPLRGARHEAGPDMTLVEDQSPRSRRHVCLVTDTYPPEINGVALTLARLARGLRERGHAVSVVRPRPAAGQGPGDDPGATIVRRPPVARVPDIAHRPAGHSAAPGGLDSASPRRGVRGDGGSPGMVGPQHGPAPRHSRAQRLPHKLPRVRAALPHRLAAAARRPLSSRFPQQDGRHPGGQRGICAINCRPAGSPI